MKRILWLALFCCVPGLAWAGGWWSAAPPTATVAPVVPGSGDQSAQHTIYSAALPVGDSGVCALTEIHLTGSPQCDNLSVTDIVLTPAECPQPFGSMGQGDNGTGGGQ